MRRFLSGFAAAFALLLAPGSAGATGAVLPPSAWSDPSTLDLAIAVAKTPFGSTRWARLTVGGTKSAMWLVPARPGASLDWASDAWLGALDNATAPRIAPPSDVAPCGMSNLPERVATWGAASTKQFPRAIVAHATEAELRAHVASRGFDIPATTSTKIVEIYAAGYALVSIEIDIGTGASAVSSPTLRVSDDAPAIVPLALTGSRATAVRVTAIVIASGGASLGGAREIDPSTLPWGRGGSTYASVRTNLLATGGGAVWVRESSSAEALFAPLPVPRAEPIPSVASAYFREATGQSAPACEGTARAAAASNGSVGRACPKGALARVPGGADCTPDAGTIDPVALTCGSGVDDLALALSGASPKTMHVTRLSGIVPQGHLGLDWTPGSPSPVLSPVGFAGSFEACPPAAKPPPSGGGLTAPSEPPPTSDESEGQIIHESGCTGTATTVVYETGEEAALADEGCGGGTTGTTTTAGDDGCGGDTTGSSSGSSDDSSDDDSSDDSGWDTDDDDDSTKSSSDDSCGSKKSSSSSSGSDGWDDPDMSPKSLKKKPLGQRGAKKTRSPSPVSRYALLFVALILPLRRRLRAEKL